MKTSDAPDCFYRVSAKAVIIIDDKLLLVKEGSDAWELPGGGVEHGESLHEALRREILEETGLNITHIVDEQPLTWTSTQNPEKSHYLLLVYKANVDNAPGYTSYNDVSIGLFTKEELETIPMTWFYQNYITTLRSLM